MFIYEYEHLANLHKRIFEHSDNTKYVIRKNTF